ncbi:MAG: hypothetical protein ACI841_002106 [Planctomycetota bacterium]|jgi:hypothetical protein
MAANSDQTLQERLRDLAADRASSARSLILEAAPIVDAWLMSRAATWSAAAARLDLAQGLYDFQKAHGWRASVARWIGAMTGTIQLHEQGKDAAAQASERQIAGAPLRELLAEEVGLWLSGDVIEGFASFDDSASEELGLAWDGQPLSAGERLPEREGCVDKISNDILEGERIVVHGYSETVAFVLEAIHEHGMKPEVLLSEGGPDLGGRRMARRLSQRGLQVSFCYDAALYAGLAGCDRLWIGSEAIGERSFLARVGTTALLHEARRQGVRSSLIATSDKCLPSGEPSLPDGWASEQWLLWESAPEGVRVDSQAFELAPLDHVESRVDERSRRPASNQQRSLEDDASAAAVSSSANEDNRRAAGMDPDPIVPEANEQESSEPARLIYPQSQSGSAGAPTQLGGTDEQARSDGTDVPVPIDEQTRSNEH